jgi:hypothetical protein
MGFADYTIEHHTVEETHIIPSMNMESLGGTYNGVITTSTTTNDINSRWRTQRLWDGFDDAIQMQHKLPLNYVAGTAIKIVVNWGANATSGTALYNVGIGGIDASTNWADDPDMTYGAETGYATQSTVFKRSSNEWTITATDAFVAGEEIVIVIYRLGTDAITDTLTTYMEISSVAIKYQVNSNGSTTGV